MLCNKESIILMRSLVVISVVNLTLIDLPGLTKIAIGECHLVPHLNALESGSSLMISEGCHCCAIVVSSNVLRQNLCLCYVVFATC